MSVAVLLTCHDRRELTLACLARLGTQTTTSELVPYVVDAGSTDGTADAVAERHPEAVVLRRGPELFWNGGMLVAWRHALADGHDRFLWLNDDTLLDDDAVARLEAVVGDRDVMVAGTTRDPDDGHPTYGGVRRPDPRRPLAVERVDPDPHRPVAAETVNGNCVLVPRGVVDRIGLLDPAFTHAMGDFDYGLRARAAGIEVLVAPGTVGTCRNDQPDPPRTVGEAWQRLTGPKGLPPREWARFARRWAGPLWPLYAASPYVRGLLRAARRRD